MRRPERAFAIVATFLALEGCGGSSPEPAVGGLPSVADDKAVVFSFASLDNRPVSSAALRGRVTVLAFGTIDNLLTQAQVRFLSAMAKNDGDKVAYVLVLLEPADRRELAELYRQNLTLTYPVAMADADTLAGRGPFGDLQAVPVVMVLDREGRVVLRRLGLVKPEELRETMRHL